MCEILIFECCKYYLKIGTFEGLFKSSTFAYALVCMYVCIRAQTNVVTFECSFVFVTFVSRFFVTKHLFILIMYKIMYKFCVKVPLMPQTVKKLTVIVPYL